MPDIQGSIRCMHRSDGPSTGPLWWSTCTPSWPTALRAQKARSRVEDGPIRCASSRPLNRLVDVCLDLLGPLPETPSGHVYLLVMVDRFTKLTRVTPLPNQDAETVASAFLDTCVASYGPPDT